MKATLSCPLFTAFVVLTGVLGSGVVRGQDHDFTATRADGRDLSIITTLYGPPGWMTLQKAKRGRDLDPQHRVAMGQYLVDWAKFLREQEGLPVKYVSLHNEGEDWMRWNQKGFTRAGQPGMAVVRTQAMDSETAIIGFASNGTRNPDAFVVINIGGARKVNVRVLGSSARTFEGFRTTEDEKNLYAPIGIVRVKNGAVLSGVPAGSVTTFFAK